MIKHGISNFYSEQVFEGDIKECFDKEIELIVSMNTKCPNGYNMTDGGEGVVAGILNEKHKYYLKHGLYWKSGEHPRARTKATPLTKQRMSEAKLKPTNVFGMQFKSVGEASEYLGLSYNSVRTMVRREEPSMDDLRRLQIASFLIDNERSAAKFWAGKKTPKQRFFDLFGTGSISFVPVTI